MLAALFEFFEDIADELTVHKAKVITSESLKAKDKDSSLLDDLRAEMKVLSNEDAIKRAVEALQKHFKDKGAKAPFDYTPATGMFSAVDFDFLAFVDSMRRIRSVGKRSRDFECNVAQRLGRRATGSIHRVGHPRDIKRKSVEFNGYLGTLGFDRPVLLGKDKDGGLDILWFLPVGALPHRPIVAVQCKNGVFNSKEAYASVGVAGGSLARYGGLQPQIHVPCVLFNDYIHAGMLHAKQMGFVPLGLSDLASLEAPMTIDMI